MTQRNLLVVKHNEKDKDKIFKKFYIYFFFASLSPQGFPGKGGRLDRLNTKHFP
jgi:hypothetical protein